MHWIRKLRTPNRVFFELAKKILDFGLYHHRAHNMPAHRPPHVHRSMFTDRWDATWRKPCPPRGQLSTLATINQQLASIRFNEWSPASASPIVAATSNPSPLEANKGQHTSQCCLAHRAELPGLQFICAAVTDKGCHDVRVTGDRRLT